MKLRINGEERSFDSKAVADVESLLKTLGVSATRGVAVAVNDEVVRRNDWANATLAEGDRVEVIRATQGG